MLKNSVILGVVTLSLAGAGVHYHGRASIGDQEIADCLAMPGLGDITGFIHQPTVFVDGQFWYFLAPELELNVNQAGQPQDLPGHCWKVAPNVNGQQRYIGRHYNTGPVDSGAPPKFWSSDAGENAQLFWVDLVISEWTPQIAARRAAEGYVHYHELVLKDDGCQNDRKVAWMRHSPISSFTIDGGPPQFREDGRPFRPRNVPHEVAPGLDFNFMPNYDVQYVPDVACGL